MQFQIPIIDETLPIRGVSFESLISLLRAVQSHSPIRYTDAMKLVTEDRAIVSKHDGQTLKKTSFYHHFMALVILGFLSKDDARTYSITLSGERLIEGEHETLDITCRSMFRDAMLVSPEINKNFLFLFTGSVAPLVKLPLGNYVAFWPTGKRRYELYSSCLDVTVPLDTDRMFQLVMSGFRRWGQQCGLLDEVFLPVTSRWLPSVSAFMYLLKHENRRPSDPNMVFRWLSRFRHVSQKLIGATLRYDLPDLIALIALNEGLSILEATKLIDLWVSRYPKLAILERPSIGLIEEKAGGRNKARLEVSQPWLVRGHQTYTSLLVLNSALEGYDHYD